MTTELSTINQNNLPAPKNHDEVTIALAKGEFEVMVDNAHKYPRNINQFMNAAISLATYDEEIAASCIFSLPRKMKNEKTGKYEQTYIKGKSIRLAEIILSVYKNIKVEVRNGAITAKSASAIATIIDLENNTVTSDCGEANIHGSHNDATKLATAAARSIALRNAIFRLIPGAFSEVIYKKAVECAVGNQKTFPERRRSVFERITKLGIPLDKILNYYKKDTVEDFTPDLIEEIIGIGSSIKQGDIKIDQAFVIQKEHEEVTESINNLIDKKNSTATQEQETENSLKEYDGKGNVTNGYNNTAAKDAMKDIKEKLNIS